MRISVSATYVPSRDRQEMGVSVTDADIDVIRRAFEHHGLGNYEERARAWSEQTQVETSVPTGLFNGRSHVDIYMPASRVGVDGFEVTEKSSDILHRLLGQKTLRIRADRLAEIVQDQDILMALAFEHLESRMFLKKEDEKRRKAERARLPCTRRNLRIYEKALKRMAEREGRDVELADALHHLPLWTSTGYLRVDRRMDDFIAHAISAGWMDPPLDYKKGDIVRGGSMAFRNGEPVRSPGGDENEDGDTD